MMAAKLWSKEGNRYKVIPFEQNKAPSKTPRAQKTLQDTIKSVLQQKGIQYGGIERHPNGAPKLGLLHKLDINDKPLKTGEGPGQGHGPVGQVKQGVTGTAFLKGIRIYQKEVTGPDGNKSVHRGIFTFRVISDKTRGDGSWEHPGLDAKNFFDKAYLWAENEWNDRIKQQVLDAL